MAEERRKRSRIDVEEKDETDNQPFHLTSISSPNDLANCGAKTFHDIFGGDYSRCFLSNFKIDLLWMVNQCPRLEAVPVFLAHGECIQRTQELMKIASDYSNITLYRPPLPYAYGIHHSKMAIFFFINKVRVAIMTNNFIPIDWGQKNQGVWLQEFSLKDSSHEPTNNFEADLTDYLLRLQGGEALGHIVSELGRFDFNSANVTLIPSVPGKHSGHDLHQFGHMKLRQILKNEVLNVNRNSPIICQFSSFGSMGKNAPWLFHEFRTSVSSFRQIEVSESQGISPLPNIQLIWPTVNDVKESLEGWNAGYAIPCAFRNLFMSRRDVNRNNVLPEIRPILFKYDPSVANRKRVMPHIKTYARYEEIKSEENGETNRIKLGWVLLTSANLSKSAWGSLQRNNTELHIRSYEMGVLFLPSKYSSETNVTFFTEKFEETKAQEHSESELLFPLPYKIPPVPYDFQVDRPWTWDTDYHERDIFGNMRN